MTWVMAEIIRLVSMYTVSELQWGFKAFRRRAILLCSRTKSMCIETKPMFSLARFSPEQTFVHLGKICCEALIISSIIKDFNTFFYTWDKANAFGEMFWTRNGGVDFSVQNYRISPRVSYRRCVVCSDEKLAAVCINNFLSIFSLI